MSKSLTRKALLLCQDDEFDISNKKGNYYIDFFEKLILF